MNATSKNIHKTFDLGPKMMTVALKALSNAINASMIFVPKRSAIRAMEKMSHAPDNSMINGWFPREVISRESGFTHRYYHHPGPGPHAPVFLFLHGLMMDARNFLRVHALSDTWQLIAYDFPDSTTFYRGDMNDFRYLLDDFLDTLGIDSFYLCGVSFGGGIALRFTSSHGRRVKALILVSTFIMNATPFSRLQSKELSRVLLKQPDYKLFWLIWKLMSAALYRRNSTMKKLKDLIRIKDIAWYRQVMRSITTCEGTEDAMQVKCPVLVMHGTRDTTIRFKAGKSILQYIPHAEFIPVQGGTHAMMYLKGEMIAEQIRAFCKKVL